MALSVGFTCYHREIGATISVSTSQSYFQWKCSPPKCHCRHTQRKTLVSHKHKHTTLLCRAEANSNPKHDVKDMFKTLVIPIATSFAVFSLALGAKASIFPRRQTMPLFANVSSMSETKTLDNVAPSPAKENSIPKEDLGIESSGEASLPEQKEESEIKSIPIECVEGESFDAERAKNNAETQVNINLKEDLGVNSFDDKENSLKGNAEMQLNQGIEEEAQTNSVSTEAQTNSVSSLSGQKSNDWENQDGEDDAKDARSSSGNQIGEMSEGLELPKDEELDKAYEKWRSKPYALTVPLRIVALRGSVPPAWLKDFVQAQGRRLKLQVEFRGSLGGIISELASGLRKGHLTPRSIIAADLVTVGDSWLEIAIRNRVIEPIKTADQQDWFIRLGDRWKAYLRRNRDGEIDPKGEIWGAPYRWGCVVVAYRKDKFVKHNIPPIEDWTDLWRPELEGKISMVDAPREVVGAVLKCLGKSYNSSLESDTSDERQVVKATLTMLQNQVRLFDSAYYLRAFGSGDVWVAVGWSSDVLPAAKRISNVVVVVPKSGTSLWADIWAIPATPRVASNKVGGRIRGPSPLINQWFDFCLQPARATLFQQNVFPGSSPLFLLDKSVDVKSEDDILSKAPTNGMQAAVVGKGEPEFETNLVAGMPPADILQKCEFLEPLSAKARLDYEWLLTQKREKERQGLASSFWQYLKGIRENFKSASPRNI